MATKHPGQAIRRARRAAELTQLWLALQIGRSPSFITNFELGRIEVSRAEIAAMRAAIKRETSK